MTTFYIPITRHNIKPGDKVSYLVDDFDTNPKLHHGVIVAVETDHFLVDVKEISDHLYGCYDDPAFRKEVIL